MIEVDIYFIRVWVRDITNEVFELRFKEKTIYFIAHTLDFWEKVFKVVNRSIFQNENTKVFVLDVFVYKKMGSNVSVWVVNRVEHVIFREDLVEVLFSNPNSIFQHKIDTNLIGISRNKPINSVIKISVIVSIKIG